MGVNLNQMVDEFPAELRTRAGSLAMALGKRVSRKDFAVALLLELERTREFAVSDSQQPPPATPDKSVAKSQTV